MSKKLTTSLKLIFNHPQYAFQLLRTMSAVNGEASDIGECLTTAQHIQEGNDDSWYKEWYQIAKRLEEEGNQYKKKKHFESTRTCFLRSYNYYRTAEFFLHTNPNDERIINTWKKSRQLFQEAIPFFNHRIEQVRIPFEETSLPAYFCFASENVSPKPLLIIQTGFDGTAEELYCQIAHAAIKRGYHCLIFEGPGQGEMIREQKIPFRHNWETVLTPVIDFALTYSQIDPQRIGVIGFSFGGYLVPRALAFEKRAKLAIMNGGVFDFHQVCMQAELAEMDEALDDPKICQEIDLAIYELMKNDAGLRWAFGNGMFTFHASSPSDWLRMTRKYQLNNFVDRISTKCLIIDADNDEAMPGQSKLLYEHLKSPKELMEFTTQEGAGAHCQIGAYACSNERIFNWLDENL